MRKLRACALVLFVLWTGIAFRVLFEARTAAAAPKPDPHAQRWIAPVRVHVDRPVDAGKEANPTKDDDKDSPAAAPAVLAAPHDDQAPVAESADGHHDIGVPHPIVDTLFETVQVDEAIRGKMEPDQWWLRTSRAVIHAPEMLPEPLQYPPVLIDEWWRAPYSNTTGAIEYSVIVPVFNRQAQITEYLTAMIRYSTGVFEYVIVFDGCKDDSEKLGMAAVKAITDACEAGTYEHVCPVHIRYIRTLSGVFEASSNNIGMRAATGKYLVVTQDDMRMVQQSWNEYLCIPHRLWDDLFWISGRCAHGLGSVNLFYGRCGSNIEQSLAKTAHDTKLHLGLTANRGPTCLPAERVRALGYLDEVNYLLGNDDHDINARARKHGWRTGAFLIEFRTHLGEGSSRWGRSPPDVERVTNARKQRMKTPSAPAYLSQYKSRLSTDREFAAKERATMEVRSVADAVAALPKDSPVRQHFLNHERDIREPY